MNKDVVDLKKIIGKGYKDFWNYKGVYLVVKGGRGSKKSTTTALKLIYNMMKYYHAYNVIPNTLVVRNTGATLKDSVYSQLKWAINKLGVDHLWKCTKNPLELIYKPSGGKILFRGLDDPLKITSITVDKGNLCWMWVKLAHNKLL